MMYWVDAHEPNKSNWLRYINCPNIFSQQNLLPFVRKLPCRDIFSMKFSYNAVHIDDGEVFYLAVRNISVGEERLVYYGDDYAKKLGIDTTQFP